MEEQRSHPAPITEADLVGWVEGTLPAARDRILRAELTRNPVLASRLQAMTHDRAVLSSIPDEQAPAGLMAAVQEAIERQTLFADAPELKISRASAWSRWASRPNMALAAGIALVLTGGVYWTMVLSNSNPIIRNVPPEVENPTFATNAGASPSTVGPSVPEPAGSGVSDIMLASMTEPAGSDLRSRSELAYANSDMETLALAEAVMLAEHGPPRRPLDAKSAEIRKALALAEEGRLVIRVRTPSGARVAGKMDALAASASRRDPVRAWRVEGDVPQQLLASITSSGPALNVAEHAVSAMPTMASSDPQEIGREMGVTVPSRMVRESLPAVSAPVAACMAEFRPTAPTLQALVAALSQKLGGEVILTEASERQAVTADPADASSVVWWTQPSGNWGKWISVPVVVEAKR